MVGHRDRRDITVKEKFQDGNGDTVNYRMKEKLYGNGQITGASPLPAPIAASQPLGRHEKIQMKIKEKFHRGGAATTTTTTAKSTTPPPPVFVAPPINVGPITITPPVMTTTTVTTAPNLIAMPLLDNIPAPLPALDSSPATLPLDVNVQETTSIIVDTPPLSEAINGTQITPQPPLLPAAENTTLPVQTFQYLPEHTYIAYDPVRFSSTPPVPGSAAAPPVISTTYVVHEPVLNAGILPVGPTATTAATTTTNSSNNGRKVNIRIREKITGTAAASAGADPACRKYKLRERIRTKA